MGGQSTGDHSPCQIPWEIPVRLVFMSPGNQVSSGDCDRHGFQWVTEHGLCRSDQWIVLSIGAQAWAERIGQGIVFQICSTKPGKAETNAAMKEFAYDEFRKCLSDPCTVCKFYGSWLPPGDQSFRYPPDSDTGSRQRILPCEDIPPWFCSYPSLSTSREFRRSRLAHTQLTGH